MAESSDNSPTGESKLDDDSDVVELTEEVAVRPSDEELEEESEANSGEEGTDDAGDGAEPESGRVTGGEDDEFDGREMVETVQVEAVDPEAAEEIAGDVDWQGMELLDDARFSPEIIATPPDVLVKKWREGPPGTVEEIIGDEPASPAGEQIEDDREQPAEEDSAGAPEQAADTGDDVDEEELDDSELDEVEPIELDDELVELEEDEEEDSEQSSPPRQPERERTSTPPPTSAPTETEQPEAPSDDNEPTARADDPEMSGLVEELLDEEREEEQEELGPRQTWFKEVFSEEYLRSVPENITEITEKEADFIEESLRLKKGSRIFDLACGFGRHSLELAHRGYEMVGLDLSMPLLQHALDAAQKRSLDIKFIHGDMRDLNFSQVFDGCFVWNTSLGYFDDQTNLGVLHGLYRALKVGGRLLVDVVNRDHVVRQTPTRLWWEGKGCLFLEETEFDHQTSTLETQRSYIYEDGTPPVEHTSYIRLYNVHELRQMLHVAGFKVLEVSGARHHKGYFLGPASKRIIILAEKKEKRKAPSSAGGRSGTKSS